VPETAVHGGFSLSDKHFISEITDFPQQPGSPKPYAEPQAGRAAQTAQMEN
jgi:hypothetical protein